MLIFLKISSFKILMSGVSLVFIAVETNTIQQVGFNNGNLLLHRFEVRSLKL